MKNSIKYLAVFSSFVVALAVFLFVLLLAAVLDAALPAWVPLAGGAGVLVCGAAARFFRPFTARLAGLGAGATALARGELRDDAFATGIVELAPVEGSLDQLRAWSRDVLSLCREARESDLRRRLSPRGPQDQTSREINGLVDDFDQAHQNYSRAVRYLHAIPTSVHVVDTEMNVRFINKAGAKAAHRSVGECIGKKCHELFHTRDCNSINCKVVQAILQDRVITAENVGLTARGEAPFRYTAAPIHDDDGKVIGAVEYIIDIRDEMRVVEMAEQISQGNYDITIPLRSEEDRLSQALNRMTATLREATAAVAEENWLSESIAAVGDRLHGHHDIYTLAHNVMEVLVDILGAQVAVFYLSQDEDTLHVIKTFAATGSVDAKTVVTSDEGLIGRAINQGRALIIEDLPPDYLKIASSLGETPATTLVILPVYFEEKLLGVIELGSHRFFGDREKVLLDRVMENVGVAIHTTNSRHELQKLLETTQRQTEMLQVQQEELQQSNEELQEQARALAASEERLQMQQEELRVSNEELEERSKALEEKNREIQAKNTDLVLTRREVEAKAKDLEVSGRYKSEFLANMSHELRTPLNSILILSQLLAANRDKNLTEKQVEFASTINNSGADLLHLINEVLDLSKIEAGRMDINPEEVDIDATMRGILGTFRPLADQKKIALVYNLEAGLPATFSTDDSRCRQIVKNLLSNAFKFTEKGSVSLTVGRPAADAVIPGLAAEPARTIFFRVEDTGIGIPRDKQEVIFEAFKQADGTTSRKFGGTGLGLSISRELAKLLGGTLTVASEEQQGSCFTLYLPERIDPAAVTRPVAGRDIPMAAPASRAVATAAPDDKAATAAPHVADEEVRDDRRSIRRGDKSILIIEDDNAFSSLLLDLARDKGFKALTAADGETGLQMADYHRPSAIILDMGLPGISGRQVLDRLKKNPETRHIPVHFISASDHASEVLQMGAIGYLTKPVSVEKLDQVFARIEKLVSSPVKRLLIVEDDAVQRQAMRALIGNGDVTTVAASSGEEAYRLLLEQPFDCIILDLGLEDMSGFDLLARIKENAKLTHIPVIIYTGRDIDRDEEERLQKYADSIIIKGARSPERLLDETTLFLHRVEKNLPPEKQEILNTLHSRESTFKDRTILLVDDDMRNVFALSSVLEENGMEIIVARNGKEALEKLEKHPEINLVLMDIMMPEMDGYEATRILRTQPRHRDLPVIALTAKAMKGDRDKCLEAGANDYLAKPVDSERLMSLLRVWLYR